MRKIKPHQENRGVRGIYDTRNRLNDLTGKEWTKWTKSWFYLPTSSVVGEDPQRSFSRWRPDRDGSGLVVEGSEEQADLDPGNIERSWFVNDGGSGSLGASQKFDDLSVKHPAAFPIPLAVDMISFFTKPGQWVIDPFAGVGSTLLASKSLGRNSVGVELYPEFVREAEGRLRGHESQQQLFSGPSQAIMLCGDSTGIPEVLEENGLGSQEFDFCLTSPPYWNQLERSAITRDIRHKKRADAGLPRNYGTHEDDLSCKEYETYLAYLYDVFLKIYGFMKPGGYLVVITNNYYANGRLVPLAFDTLRYISDPWVPKDEKIWLSDHKLLRGLAAGKAYIANRHHQYCLVFRKPEDK